MKTAFVALRFFLCMTVLTGFIYPMLITAFGQVAFNEKANGSLIRTPGGPAVGSELIAQNFKGAGYFWPRPSAVDFNPMPSGGSNLGPTSADLQAKVKERAGQGRAGDLLFASGSGLDPHISPESALGQIARVSQARRLPEARVRGLVERSIEGRQFGVLGEPRVNVLKLNLALDGR